MIFQIRQLCQWTPAALVRQASPMLGKTDSLHHMHDDFEGCLDAPSLHAPPSLSSGKGALPSGRNPQSYSNVLDLSSSSMLFAACKVQRWHFSWSSYRPNWHCSSSSSSTASILASGLPEMKRCRHATAKRSILRACCVSRVYSVAEGGFVRRAWRSDVHTSADHEIAWHLNNKSSMHARPHADHH